MQMTQSPYQYSFMASVMRPRMPMQQPYIYMRIGQQAGERSVLVASKTRVAPLTGILGRCDSWKIDETCS